MARTNKFPGNCSNCNTRVAEQAGFIFQNRGWKVSCNSERCLEANGLLEEVKAEVKKAERREITANGEVFFPYDANVVKLVKSLPGAKWDPANRHWTIDLNPAHARRIIEVAEKCRLSVPDILMSVNNPLVDAAFARANSAGAFPFQLEGAKWLAGMQYALLGDDMGLGKTWQALLAADATKGLICIVPSSVKLNWAKECRKLRSDITPVVLKGTKSFRLPEPGEMVILNPEILPTWLKPTVITCVPWHVEDGVRSAETNCRNWRCKDGMENGKPCSNCKGTGIDKKFHHLVPNIDDETRAALANCWVIADECHMYKNYKALRSKKVKALCELVAGAWGLTGTPMLNRPLDLWGVLQVFNLTRLTFGGYRTFARLYDAQKNRWGGTDWGMPSDEVAERLRAGMLRRLKKNVMPDLPPKTFQDIVVELNDRDLKKDLDLLNKRFGMDDFGDLDAEDMILMGEEMDLELPPFEEFSEIRARLAADRIEAMLEIVESYEDADEPLIVASAHRAPIDTLGKREGWAAITGDTPIEVRQDIVTRFQEGEFKGVALTIAAGGVGLTLTRASHMLFVDLDWTPALNVQAEDRINRIGQESGATVYKRMVSDHPLDRHVHNLLAYKMHLIANSLDTEVEVDESAFKTGPGIRTESDEEYEARISQVKAERERKAREEAAAKVDKIRHERVPVWLRRQRERATREEVELTPERIDMVRHALNSMLSVCDGAEKRDAQGFNKPDSMMAVMLAATGLEEEPEIRTAERMLSRYYRQLHRTYPDLFV